MYEDIWGYFDTPDDPQYGGDPGQGARDDGGGFDRFASGLEQTTGNLLSIYGSIYDTKRAIDDPEDYFAAQYQGPTTPYSPNELPAGPFSPGQDGAGSYVSDSGEFVKGVPNGTLLLVALGALAIWKLS